MSDDRELVERLALIDATPRASWVAELRADLDAAWETRDARYLDSLPTTRLTLVDHDPAAAPTEGRRRSSVVAVAAAVVVAIGVGALLAARDDGAPNVPADTGVDNGTTVAPDAAIADEDVVHAYMDAYVA